MKKNPAADPEVLSEIEVNIYDLVDRYISELNDPEEIYQNNGLFIDMLKYIYRYYVCILLDNKHNVNNRYDYKILDNLFNIYTSLVYKYKKNKQPYINEFCLFVNISRETLYNIRYGQVKKASPEDLQNVKKWFTECEQGLLNTDTVGSIFRLKAMFNYNDNLAPVPIELQNQVLSANQLPDLGQKVIEDKGGKS